MRLVQIANGSARRVALVGEPHLHCLDRVESRLRIRLGLHSRPCAADPSSSRSCHRRDSSPMTKSTRERANGTCCLRSMSPGAPERVLVSGTGLTHLGSAKDRQAMHVQTCNRRKPLTDSMRMFEWGIAGGRPKEGEIGVAPEWFYKGHGRCRAGALRAADCARHTPKTAEKRQKSPASISSMQRHPISHWHVRGQRILRSQLRAAQLSEPCRFQTSPVQHWPRIRCRRRVPRDQRRSQHRTQTAIHSGKSRSRRAKKTWRTVWPTLSIITSNSRDIACPGHVHVHFFGAPLAQLRRRHRARRTAIGCKCVSRVMDVLCAIPFTSRTRERTGSCAFSLWT